MDTFQFLAKKTSDDVKSLDEAMMIDPERVKVLDSQIKDGLDRGQNLGDSLTIATQNLQSQDELIYISVTLGAFVGKRAANPLVDLLSSLK
jgi:hypothetical protein